MTIETQDGYDPGDDPAGVPLIGYDNQISAVTASSEDTDHPANNLLNSATHLFWQAEIGTSTNTLLLTTAAQCDYLAVAGHNFSAGMRVSLASATSSTFFQNLLHFDAADASTLIRDSSGNDHGWQVQGNAQIDTAQFKFGSASCLFDGTGDYLEATQNMFEYGSQDFTIDFWLRLNTTGVTQTLIDARSSEPMVAIRLYVHSGNTVRFYVNGSDRITGATALTTGVWNHIALTREGTSTKLFLNGSQQGSTYTDSNVYLPSTSNRIGINRTTTEGLNGWIDEFRTILGQAAWTTTFSVPTAAYSGPTNIIGTYSALFHFDGVDGSTMITDSGGNNHTFTAQNGAQLDTAQFKFGTSSCLFDGSNDYVQGDGSGAFAFAAGDFTIDFWVRFNSTAGQQLLYDSRPSGTTGPYIAIYKDTSHFINLFVNGTNVISSSPTTVSAATWTHIALVRSASDDSTYLFINGTQVGSTYTDTNNYLNGTDRPIIGASGDLFGGQPFNGWIDELRIIKGVALWTATFIPPSFAADSSSPGYGFMLDDNLPLILRFSPTANSLFLRINGGTEVPRAAVIYAGELLVLERSIKVDVGHFNVTHARRSNILAGMSESGNFLGRSLLAEWRESQADFAWFTPDWYRSYFEPFVQSALTEPFFWVWNPDEYPDETAFAWLIDDVRPETDPATRRVATTIFMRAIA